MFKLLFRSVPKSNQSLTKFSNIYKKIRSAFHSNTLQQQTNGSKPHSKNTEDNSQRGAKKFEITLKTSRTFSTSCVGKTGLKFLKKSLFPEKCNGRVKLVMFSTSSSKYFYSSTMKQSKENNKKYFKNHRALDLYKKAFEQCMKIKFEKHRIDRANNKIGWTPEPYKVNYPQELVVISDKKKTKDTPKPTKVVEQPPKQILRLIPKKSMTVNEMAQKRRALEQKKRSSNHIKRKMKIVYPSHTIKHNLGVSTSYHVDKSVRDKIEILSKVKNKRGKQSKPIVNVNTIEVIPYKQKLDKKLLKIMSSIKKRREEICEENAQQTDDAIKHLISQHPTVRKATEAAKMSINKKYNVILLKSQAKVQIKMLKPEELVEENVTIEKIPAAELKNVPTEADETISDKMSEKPIIYRNQPGSASKITQHPILPSKFQAYPDETVRYPKTLLVDKSETFDIDGICLRTKESYVAYVDEIGETLTKMPNYPETLNTNIRKEQDKNTLGHQKTHNLKPLETQNNVKPYNVDAIKTIENLTKYSSSKERKEDFDTNENVSQPKNHVRTVSPTQSLQYYLRMLNELKDQSAVDRLSVEKYPNRKSIMVENLNVKKLNSDWKNKMNSGEKVDAKEIGTVNGDNKRREYRSVTENVTKLEDATGSDENAVKKIIDDRVVEKNMKGPINIEKANKRDSIEKLANMIRPKSEPIVMEETNGIHPSEVKPLYEKLLERNREQVSADERKKFKLKLDQNISKRKAEAKRKVLMSNARPMTEPAIIKSSSIQKIKSSKYLLENYQPVTEMKATEGEIIEKDQDKVIPTENKLFRKILQQYTVKNKTDTGIKEKQSIQDKQRRMEDTDRDKFVSEHMYNLENYFDHDVHASKGKAPTAELKIHSIAVEKHNYSGNDLTPYAETFSENIKSTDAKNVRKDHTLESKYTEKLKNLLGPANQYLEKLREAGENQMKSLGDLKSQFKNQLSENIGKSLKIKQLKENTPKVNDNLIGDEVTELPGDSSKPNQDENLRKSELIEVHKNQPIGTLDSGSNVVESLPNECMDCISLSKDKSIPDQIHRYALQAYQDIKVKDVTKRTNVSENSEEEYEIKKIAVELKKPLEQSSNNLSDKMVKTTEYLSRVNRDTIVKGINPVRKEYISDEPNEIFDEELRDSNSAVKETFLYILKEKEPEQNDLETNIVEAKNKVDGENVPKILEENHILHNTRNIPDFPEGFNSKHHIEDNVNHENLLQDRATCLSQSALKYSPEQSSSFQKSSVVENGLSSSHLTNLNNFEKNQPVFQDEVFSQPVKSTNTTLDSVNEEKVDHLKEDESDGDQVIEPSSEKNQTLSYIENSSQNFVLLHNRPTIRKENPPRNNPKTDNNKKDKSKTKKDLILPPPKNGDTPKMVEDTSAVKDTEISENRILNDFNNKLAKKHTIEESNYMKKADLEDIVFSYRSKPRYDQNELLKNWLTILAFIEELEITYKDGSDANLIKMSEEINNFDEESNRKLTPIDINENKLTSLHQNNMKKIDTKIPEKPIESFGEAIVENNTVVDITRLKPEKRIDSDEDPTIPSTIDEDPVFQNSLMKSEKPTFPKNNEDVDINLSKQFISNTKIDETSKSDQKQDIRTDSTILPTNLTTTGLPQFPKKIKWPPKTTTTKFKFPQSPNMSDEVSEPKLSRKKVWMPRESPKPKFSKMGEKLESNEISVSSKLKIGRSEQPSTSNFLEDHLKKFKSKNKKSEALFFRENLSDHLTKTKSALLKTFLLDEDEEIEVAKIGPEPNGNSRKSSLKTKEYLNKYSKEEKSHYHLNSPVEKSRKDVNTLKKSKSLSLRPEANISTNSSKSEELRSNKIVPSNVPGKHTKSEQRTVPNTLDQNLNTCELPKPNLIETSYEGVDERSSNENNSPKFSRLLKMFSLDDSEYPESTKHLKRAHTVIIPNLGRSSYQDKQKLRKKEYDNVNSTSQYDNQVHNEKVDELMDSSTPEKKIITPSTTALKKKQQDRCCEEIHLKRNYQVSEKYKTGYNPTVKVNMPKKPASCGALRLRKELTDTELSSKSPVLKTYSLERNKSRENTKQSKKTEPLAISIEELNKMEKTTECFSLYFRKTGQSNRTGMKKEDNEPNTKEVEEKSSKCLVKLTLPNINSGKLKQVASCTDSKEPLRGQLDKILETGNLDSYPKDVRIPNLKNLPQIECSSSSRNSEIQESRSEAKHDFDEDKGDDDKKEGAPKLRMKVLLPKNWYIIGNKAENDGIQLQKKEPEPQKDENVPGKLKKKAIFRLIRTFELPGKHRLSKNKLEKVSKVSNDTITSRNMPLVAKNSNVIENSRIISNKNKANLKIAEDKQINPKNNTLREMYTTVHLNRIMDKYRVNTEKLQDLHDQNVGLTEVELFERRRSKERVLEAFNKRIRNNSKIVSHKVEKITMESIIRSMKKQNKLNFKNHKAEQVKICSSHNTLNEKKNAKTSLLGELTTGKSKHRKKQHQYQGKQKHVSDIRQKFISGSDKDEYREIRKIKGIQKSNKQKVKKSKLVVSKPHCNSLEYHAIGQEKEKHSKKNMYPSKNSMKHQGAESGKRIKAKYGNYCLQDQFKRINKEIPIEEKKLNTKKQTSNNTNYLKPKSKRHDRAKRKHEENHGVKKNWSQTKQAKKRSHKYLLERPMSSQCVDLIISEKQNEQISPVFSTEKELVYSPSSTKYSLKRQILVYRISLAPNEQFNNVTKTYSADEIKDKKGKFETRAKLIEKETRKMSRANIQEILPKTNIVLDPSDFSERTTNPDRSSSFLNKAPGLQDCNENTVVAKIKNILASRQKILKVNKNTNSESSTIRNCETNSMQIKYRNFNKFLIAEQKSGMADNGKIPDIDQERTLKMERKIPERGTKLINTNIPHHISASNAEKILGEKKNIKSMELIPKENNTRYTTVVVEKKLPLYPLVEVEPPKQPVTKFCYKIQIPPKSIQQVLLSQPRSDVTTLTDSPRREIMAIPKNSNPKCGNIKITYITVNRKPDKFDENFLPALMPNKAGNKTVNEKIDFQMNKEQILKLRYQLLKQLREEFEVLNNKQIDRMLQSGTEKSDNKSVINFKLTENKAIDDENPPKNNTEILIKKLSEKDQFDKKGKPEKPEGDPKKK